MYMDCNGTLGFAVMLSIIFLDIEMFVNKTMNNRVSSVLILSILVLCFSIKTMEIWNKGSRCTKLHVYYSNNIVLCYFMQFVFVTHKGLRLLYCVGYGVKLYSPFVRKVVCDSYQYCFAGGIYQEILCRW